MRCVRKSTPKISPDRIFESFLEISPNAANGMELARKQIEGRDYQRKKLSDVLVAYNHSLGRDEAAIRNAERLSEPGSVCVMTGQQLGMMGGPVYTILKAITCLQMAKEAGAIPVFWWATEDHDVGEIDHTYLLDPKGNLQKFHLSLPKDGRFVEDLVLEERHFEELERFQKVASITFDCKETSYTRYMLRFLSKLFEGTGLVFVEPYLLRPFAVDFFKKEVEQADEIKTILEGNKEKLVAAGGKPLLEFTGETNLFWKEDEMKRRKVKKTHPVKEIQERPELFSTNAAARTVLQSLLFPVLSYVAGPGEMRYYCQLKEYHAFHNVPMPWIVPRLSVTFVPPYANEMLEKCGLKPWETIPDHWKEAIPGIDEGIKGVKEEWERTATERFQDMLAPESIKSAIKHYSAKFQKKVIGSRLRRRGIPSHSLHLLQNLFHPHQKPQERVFNWLAFQGETDEDLIKALLKEADWRKEGHLYCFI